MKLANLAYETVKDAIEFPSGFNKDGFIRGEYDSDRDFNSQISFVFSYLNLAFTRLFTEKKTLLKTTEKTSDATGYIEFQDGEITSIASSKTRDYRCVDFKPFMDGVAIEPCFVSKPVTIEYRKFIPSFSLESLRTQTLDENEHIYNEEVDIELKDYGITDEMCAYAKEYAKGGLMEYLSPELSQKHTQMAESYFANLETRYTDYPPNRVDDVVQGGGVW